MDNGLSLGTLTRAVCATAAAFRCVTEYQPAGGPGDKVFPPTYADDKAPGKHAWEERRLPGEDKPVPCVLLDSVQSQANRMEMALLEAWEAGRIKLPVITVDFSGNELERDLRITSLEAPHRIADAILRDSLVGGKPFRKSELGEAIGRRRCAQRNCLIRNVSERSSLWDVGFDWTERRAWSEISPGHRFRNHWHQCADWRQNK